MAMRDIYELCLEIAKKAHYRQFRNDGVTHYIEHPLAVADMFDDYIGKSIAILHDSIEDGKVRGVDMDYIRTAFVDSPLNEKYSKEFAWILHVVTILTHHKSTSYTGYIKTVRKDPFAKKVKIADIICNLSDSPSDYQKLKYKKAMKLLLEGAL